MRTASGLMIAALLTTSMISGTFAKYTTADAAQDSARAAKWGVNLGISGSLYGDAETETIRKKNILHINPANFIVRMKSAGFLLYSVI